MRGGVRQFRRLGWCTVPSPGGGRVPSRRLWIVEKLTTDEKEPFYACNEPCRPAGGWPYRRSSIRPWTDAAVTRLVLGRARGWCR